MAKWLLRPEIRTPCLSGTIMTRRFGGRQRHSFMAPASACDHKHLLIAPRQHGGDKLGLRHRCSASSSVPLMGASHDQRNHHHHHHNDHDHDHDHDHCHAHGHSHGDGLHGHDHEHYPDNWATRAMRRVGLVQLASEIEHSGTLAAASILCFLLSLLLAALPLAAPSSPSAPPLPPPMPGRVVAGLQSAALAGTYLLSGLPQAVSSLALAADGRLDTHVLMAAAVVATLVLGMAQEGALLLLLFQVSHFLEAKFTSRAQGSLERLLAATPERATLVTMTAAPPHQQQEQQPQDSEQQQLQLQQTTTMATWGPPAPTTSSPTSWSSSAAAGGGGGGVGGGGGPDLGSCVEVLAERVEVGQLVLVRPGEQVPLDGEVVWGAASVSSAHISGESAPARVAAGDWVPAGAMSADGALVVRVTAGAEDSTPARIARLAAQAQASKPQLQRLLDRVGSLWSRGVVAATLVAGLALVAAGVPLLAAPGGALYRALGVLVAGSPCAVVLVPLAYVCAAAAVTRRGVLLKGASALDALAACTTVALDKTGTLTTGELRLTEAALLATHVRSNNRTHDNPGRDRDAGVTLSSDSGACRQQEEEQQQPQSARGRDLLPLLQRAAAAAAARAGVSESGSGNSDGGSSCSEGEDWDWWQQRPHLQQQGGDSGRGAEATAAAADEEWWGEVAVRVAVAVSRASTHPVSRAVAEAGRGLARGVSVMGLEQVPGSGVRGVCRLRGRSFLVSFGSRDFAERALAEAVRSAAAGAASAASAAAGIGAATDMSADRDAEATAEAAVGRFRAALEAGGGGGGTSGVVTAVKAVSLLVVTPLEAPPPRTPSGGSVVVRPAGEPRVALFCFEDVVRPGVREAVAALQDGSWRRRPGVGGVATVQPSEAAALRVVMLTGDNPAVAASVAGGLSIPDYRAALMPHDKLDFVQREQRRLREQQGREQTGWGPLLRGLLGDNGSGGGGAVLMMGDGINDAPALAAAHVGVAVASSPRDLVAAASDVIVLNGQGAAALPWLLRLAHRTQSVVRQNLVLALASMAFATLPTLAGCFPLWLAVALHEGSTLAVALNSLRLLLSEEQGGQGEQAAAAAAGGAGSGPRAALAEVWRGLCDLAASEPHGHHHHHHHDHHHGQSHSHGHSHSKGHSHDHEHDDHACAHDHDHQQQQQPLAHRNGHEHERDCGSSGDHSHGHHSHQRQQREGRRSNGTSAGVVEVDVEAPAVQQLQHPPEQHQLAQEDAAGGAPHPGDLVQACRPSGRDVSPAAFAAPMGHLHGHVAASGLSCSSSGGWGCCSGSNRVGWRTGGVLGPLLAVADGGDSSAITTTAVRIVATSGASAACGGDVAAALRRRRRVAGRIGPVGLASGGMIVAAAATNAAAAAVAL